MQAVPNEQLEQGDTQTLENHTENKRNSLEAEDDHPKPPTSSATKDSIGKQTRAKRQK